jgi:hypothetical protein
VNAAHHRSTRFLGVTPRGLHPQQAIVLGEYFVQPGNCDGRAVWFSHALGDELAQSFLGDDLREILIATSIITVQAARYSEKLEQTTGGRAAK